MDTPQSKDFRDSFIYRALYLALLYSLLIALSPQLSLPRWIGVTGLGLGLGLLLLFPRQTRISHLNPKQITLLQALFILVAVFPFCAAYYAVDQLLR
jgi:hypothetical protein